MVIHPGNIFPATIYSRIISLVPSITELLYDLGLEEEVTGITKFCVHPLKWYKSKKRVGGTKNVKIETVHLIKPDLIIANKEENVKEQIEELSKTYDVLITDVHNLRDAINMIKETGALVGKADQSYDLINSIERNFQELRNFISSKRKIKSSYLIWQNPYMTIGGDTFINDMMQHCGLENIFHSKKRYPEISINEIKESGCQLVILSSEPYPFKEKHLQEIQTQMPRVKIILADGEMFSWYGSRLLKAPAYFEEFSRKITGIAN